MELIKDALNRPTFRELLARANSKYDDDPKAQAQRTVDRYNASTGSLDDGFDCPKCKNRGYIFKLTESFGAYYEARMDCECMAIRANMKRIRESGLERLIKERTFETFTIRESWQEQMIKTARAYLEGGVSTGKWLYMGGAVGCGKTHICTAVCIELLKRSIDVRYMLWYDESRKIRALTTDAEAHDKAIESLKNVDVLYIDDLFKHTCDNKTPTRAEVDLAFDILNYRYINQKPTIMSSERYLNEVMGIDDATGSRVYERARGYALKIDRDQSKNQRLKNAE